MKRLRDALTQKSLKNGEVKSKRQQLAGNFAGNLLPFALNFFVSLRRFCFVILFSSLTVFAQSVYEDRRIETITVTFEGADRAVSAAQQLELVARNALGTTYSAVKVRDALDALYKTQSIVSAKVEASPAGDAGVNLRFVIRRKTQAEKVIINVGNTVGDGVTEQELLLKLNLLNPGTAITDQTLRNNADLILVYLRERGFFNAEVSFTQQPTKSDTEVTVTFQVTPNAQAKVESFTVVIDGFNAAEVRL